MEVDNEVSGNGNSYTTEFRQYDPRLGRWKSLDPLMAQFPSMSPYCAFDNNPVYYIDPYGLSSVNETDGDPPAAGSEKVNPTTGTVYSADGEGGWIQNIEEVEAVGDKNPSLKSDAEGLANEIISTAGSAGAVIENNEKYLSNYDRKLFYSNSQTLEPNFATPTPLGVEVEKILLKQDYLEIWDKKQAKMIAELSSQAKTTTEREAVNNAREEAHSQLKGSFMMASMNPEAVATILFMGIGSGSSSGYRRAVFKYYQRIAPSSGLKVFFGKTSNQINHAFRHTDAMGLSREVVQNSVTRHLPSVVDDIAVGSSQKFTISAGGKNIVYSAHKFSDGSINVGRITATGAKVK